MTSIKPDGRPTLEPVLTLQVPLDAARKSTDKKGSRLSVSSTCFLPNNSQNSMGACDLDDCSSDEEEAVSFRCRYLVSKEKRHDGDITAGARNAAASLNLSGTRLVSCHTNGDAFIWDLGQRRIVREFADERRGQGLALRRLSAPSNDILYQTRDPSGTVTIHNAETMNVVTKFETRSLTFCTAAPCEGNSDLMVLPSADRCYANVRDIRISPESAPLIRLHGASLDESVHEEKHGMLTSVAMAAESNGGSVVCCGMESGSVFFHDLRMTSTVVKGEGIQYKATTKGSCSVTLGKDPVLGLDLASSAPTFGQKRSFVSIAGMAGDAAELSELPIEERGTVAVVKAIFDSDKGATARLRARVSTCAIAGPDESIRGGKPGVSLCRFRPDGRVFGVGGWDKRVRIFDRTGNASPLAVLKGHKDSITALDWAPDSQNTGYLATGAADGKICIWRCFPSNH